MRLWPAEKAQLNSWRVLHETVQLEHVDPHGDVYGPARVERHACGLRSTSTWSKFERRG